MEILLIRQAIQSRLLNLDFSKKGSFEITILQIKMPQISIAELEVSEKNASVINIDCVWCL